MCTRRAAKRPIAASAIAAALLLGGCATATPPPVSITRYHRIDTPAVVPGDIYQIVAEDSYSGRIPVNFTNYLFEHAVAQRLEALGFRSALTLARGDPDLLVSVRVDRTAQPASAGDGGGGVSIGVGGGTGGFRSGGGVGVGVGIDLTRLLRGAPRDSLLTTLSVRITRRSEAIALWEGRAETVVRDGAPQARPDAVATRLTEALFRDYPGRSGETITVP